MQKNKRYEWDKMEGCEWIRDTEMVNQPLYYDLETVASLLNQQDKRIKELKEENQDKISFAVEQIVKTKETLIKFLQDEGFYENEWYDLFDKIDNQIKKLKGEEKMTEVEIENNFTYHAPSADMLSKFEKIRNKAKELSFLINELVPNGREQSLAQTKLQEVVMWANAGIAIPKNNTKQEDLPEYVKKNLHGDMGTVKEQLSEIKDNLELKGYVLISEAFNPISNKYEVIFRRRKGNETR